MNNTEQRWTKTQLHWDDKKTIQSQKIPKSIIFNWRRMNQILQDLCKRYSLLNNKAVMVDIGCGGGKFYYGLEPYVELYIGIDPSDKMLSYASRSEGQYFIRGVGEQLPLRDNFADIVLIKSVLDQCYDPHRFISESFRVLKNKGWILISLSNRSSYYSILRKIYNRLRNSDSDHFFQESHQFYFNVKDVVDLLKKHQFNVIYQVPFGYFVFPRFLEWMIPNTAMPILIKIADEIGTSLIPQNGGGFITLGQKKYQLIW